MKNLIFTTILIISNYSVFGQEAKVITDKEKYKFDEVIKVTFEIDAKYDSIALPDFTGLKLIGGPFKILLFPFRLRTGKKQLAN